MRFLLRRMRRGDAVKRSDTDHDGRASARAWIRPKPDNRQRPGNTWTRATVPLATFGRRHHARYVPVLAPEGRRRTVKTLDDP
jgi:hypothetical protein